MSGAVIDKFLDHWDLEDMARKRGVLYAFEFIKENNELIVREIMES